MSAPSFEVRAFRALPAAATVAVLVLEGRFRAEAPQSLGRPRLLVEEEGGGSRAGVAPVVGPDAAAGPGGVPWRAAFAVPLELVPRAAFALAVGRDLLVDLPPPDLGERRDDSETARLARLARDANDLRRRLDEAREAAAAAGRARDAALSELDAARAELAGGAAAAEEQAARAAQAAREEAERRHEEVLAGQRAKAMAARRSAHADTEVVAPGAAPAEPDPELDDVPPLELVEPVTRRSEPDAAVTEPLPVSEEGVRVLSRAPRRRHSAEDELEPMVLAPGATKMGARSITSTRAAPAPGRRSGGALPRIAALVALAIAVTAFVLVVILGVGA